MKKLRALDREAEQLQERYRELQRKYGQSEEPKP
jgi:hypothetical protein